jgi:hypothetical protein
LSKPFQKNVKKASLFPVEYSVSCMLDVVDGLDEGHSGGLYDYAGKSIDF